MSNMSEFLSPSEARVLINHYVFLFTCSDPSHNFEFLDRAESFIKYLPPNDPYRNEISYYRYSYLSSFESPFADMTPESEVDDGC